MQVLDYDGLALFWDNLKRYIGTNVKSVNLRFPDVNGDVNVMASHIRYCNDESHLEAELVQDAVDELNTNILYNATYEVDATLIAAPPNLLRGYNWHVDWLTDEYGEPLPLENEYHYRRFFYVNAQDAALDQPTNPNIQAAVASWVISDGGGFGQEGPGRRVVFEYWNNGEVTNTIELSDVTGAVLRPRFRPISVGDIWFFGEQQGAHPFPVNDNIRSILDLNVRELWYLMGNPQELTTKTPTLVAAINMLEARQGEVRVIKAADATEAKQLSELPENKNAFVYVAREEL